MANTTPYSRKRVVLVIDADNTWVDSFRRFFEMYSFRVFAAADGISGLDAAHFHRPDAVVLADDLRRLTGFELARRLRAAYPTMPLIMISRSGEQGDKLQGIMAGADRLFTKPCAPMRILDSLVQLLDLPGLPARAAGDTTSLDTERTTVMDRHQKVPTPPSNSGHRVPPDAPKAEDS